MRKTSWRTQVESRLAKLKSPQLSPTESIDAIIDIAGLYGEAIRKKGIWAWLIRSASVALATIGLLLPIVSQLVIDNGKQAIPPFWSSVALAAAAALISLDYYLKIWESWKNCIVTVAAIHREVDRVQLEQQVGDLSSSSIDYDTTADIRTRSRLSRLVEFVRSRVESEKKESDWSNPRARTTDLLQYCRPFPRGVGPLLRRESKV